MEEQQHIFTNKMLRTLLIPVIFEQELNSLIEKIRQVESVIDVERATG